MKTLLKSAQRIRMTLVIILGLFLLVLPVAAQETDTAAGLPSGWMWGVMLFLMLMILLLAGIILYLLREQAKAGNKQAADLLKGFEAAKDVIPLDKVRGLLDQMERRAETSPNPWDDIAVGGILKGVELLLQRTAPTEGEIPVPVPTETNVNITNNAAPPTGGASTAPAIGFHSGSA